MSGKRGSFPGWRDADMSSFIVQSEGCGLIPHAYGRFTSGKQENY